MSNFISPAISLPILSEAVTINITPCSRYGEQFDVARFTTDIHLAQPLANPQKFLLPKFDVLSKNGPVMTLPDGKEISFDPIDAGALQVLKDQLMQEVQQFIAEGGATVEKAQKAKNLIDQVMTLELLASSEEIPAGTNFIKFVYTKKVELADDGYYTLESIVPLASFTAQGGSHLHILVAAPFDPRPAEIRGTWVNPQGQSGDLVAQDIQNRLVYSAYWQNDPELTIKYKY